jgi:hypothetical protein
MLMLYVERSFALILYRQRHEMANYATSGLWMA